MLVFILVGEGIQKWKQTGADLDLKKFHPFPTLDSRPFTQLYLLQGLHCLKKNKTTEMMNRMSSQKVQNRLVK